MTYNDAEEMHVCMRVYVCGFVCACERRRECVSTCVYTCNVALLCGWVTALMRHDFLCICVPVCMCDVTLTYLQVTYIGAEELYVYECIFVCVHVGVGVCMCVCVCVCGLSHACFR